MRTALDTTCFSSAIENSLEQLKEEINSLLQQNNKMRSFEQKEEQMHAVFLDAQRKVIEELLCQYDIDIPIIHLNNKPYRQVVRCHRTYTSTVGPVRLMRSLYRTKDQADAICPMELGAGMIESQWTPKAAKQALLVTSQLTPYEAENLFAELGAMTPSKSSLDRLPKKLGHRWQDKKTQFELSLREQKEAPEHSVALSVSLDGVLIPMQGGRILPGDSRYEEASCGTLTYYDIDGNPLTTRRHGCMPEHKKKTLKLFLKEEVEYALKQEPKLQLVKVADGARDNWSFLDNELPEGLSVLDFYHAAEHLKKAFDLAYPKDQTKASVAFCKYRHVLRHDTKGIEKVIQHLRYLVKKNPKKALLLTELNYFKNNKRRCRYAQIAEDNLPIGSGMVEATCKTLVSQRLKRSGMCWGMEGGQSILTFRSLLQSQLFDQAWRMLSAEYKAEINLPNNVVLFQKRK